MQGALDSLAACWPDNPWLIDLCQLAGSKWDRHPHGDLPRWLGALGQLPRPEVRAILDRPAPQLGGVAGDPEQLKETLMEWHPWRKGPFQLGGVRIETEWRSDWKWNRVAPHIDLQGQRVLDIGCGNGYFGWRMLGAGARLVLGIDPTVLFVVQWLACRHFAGDLPNYVLPLGVEELPAGKAELDTVFSMGVLYHRRDPAHHLARIHSLLKSGGTMVLETLVLPKGREDEILVPGKRYARMPNVWLVPGTGRLLDWIGQAGFRDAEIVDVSVTRPEEQRSTDWMTFESLEQALQPGDGSKTIEGLPAPVRAMVIARS